MHQQSLQAMAYLQLISEEPAFHCDSSSNPQPLFQKRNWFWDEGCMNLSFNMTH